MQLQIRRFLPDGETPQEVIDTARVRLATAGSSSSALTFSVSIAVADGIRQWMEDNPGKPFVVGVEHSNGGAWSEPRNGLFVAYKGSADDLDPTGSQQIVCMDMVTWDLLGTYLHWSEYAKDGARLWTETGHPASAGTIMGGMILESQGRGWAPTLDIDFTWDKDSDGVAWTAAEKVLQEWRLLTPLSQVLDSLTKQGLCEWWSEGRTLRLFRPGKGELRDNVVLGGAGFTRAPGSWDYSNVVTNLTVVPEKAANWLYLPNPGADASTGRREATMSQAGVADHATATRLAQSALLNGRAAQREQSYEWQVIEGMPVPFIDFQVGDTVKILTTIGERLERVVELVLSTDEDGLVTAHVVTGDLIRSKASKRNQTVDNANVGGIVGGSGVPLPVTSPPALGDPLPPTGLHVASNVGSWRGDGVAQAAVKIQWNAVSQTVDGSAVDIATYEVAVRTPDSEAAIFAIVTGLSVVAFEWEPGKERLVRVRARDHRGQVSAWSGEISVTPEVPASIVPKAPTGLAVTANTGAFLPDGRARAAVSLSWDAVTLSIDDELVDVDEYEIRVGLETHRVASTSGMILVPTGETVAVTVRARSNIGVWGDPSPAVNVTGAAPAALLPAPTAPILSSSLAMVAVRWHGTFVSGVVGGFSRVLMETADSAAGPWLPVGPPLTGPGGASIRGTMGQEMFFRLTPEDTLGRKGAPSQVVSVVVVGITGPDIEANSVGANHVIVGSLSVKHVEPAFGGSLDISANESINFVVGRQDQTDARLDGVADHADDLDNRLTEHQTYYRFGAEGLAIGDPDSANELRLKPNRIEMTQQGVTVSYWEGGVLVADETRLKRSLIGNHRFEEYGAGRTIIRPIA